MIKKYFEKLQIALLAISSMITTVTIFLIVIFLFSYGIKFFTNSSIEKGYDIVVHESNPIQKLSPVILQQIFDQEYTFWHEVGGNQDSLEILHFEDLPNYYTEEQMGAEFELVGACITDYLSKHPNAITIIPSININSSFKGKIVEVASIKFADVFTTQKWFPTSKPIALFGILPMIIGTLLVSFGAIVLALPFGIACAIYMAEIMKSKWRKYLKPTIELLAGIPSVVYGFFGLVVIVPIIKNVFQLEVGETALAGSIILAIMALPTIITITEDAIQNVPNSVREASLSLGASKWQTILYVVLPFAKNGIITATVLGIGRAIGETMAVLMVTGNSAIIPNSFLQPVRTIPATIAAELGEAPFGGTHFQALFTLGCILFLFSMGINLYVNYTSRSKN
jgi:phosphate transport system permease protein